MKLQTINGSFMSRGIYPVYSDPTEAPGQPTAWMRPNLRDLFFTYPGQAAIPLYTLKQTQTFRRLDWPLSGEIRWRLFGYVYYVNGDARLTTDLNKIGFQDYYPLYAVYQTIKGTWYDRFLDWWWFKRTSKRL